MMRVCLLVCDSSEVVRFWFCLLLDVLEFWVNDSVVIVSIR